ncbi:hypothetical protein V8C86DRAFT_2528164 [Haematococcus lacustris]
MDTFGGSRSMRVNYQDGVASYYARHGDSYRNPHFPAICAATSAILDVWRSEWLAAHPLPPANLSRSRSPGCSTDTPGAGVEVDGPWVCAPCCHHPSSGYALRLLDLACGSGEATQALLAWWHGSPSAATTVPDLSTKASTSTGQPLAQMGGVQGGGQARGTESVGPPARPCCSGSAAGTGGLAEAQQQGWAAAGGGSSREAQQQSQQGGPLSGCSLEVGAQWMAGSGAGPAAGVVARAASQGQQAGQGVQQLGPGGELAAGGPLEPRPGARAGVPLHWQHAPPAGPAAPLPLPLPPRGRPGRVPGALPHVALQVDAADPYTGAAYQAWTGRAAETFSFEDVCRGMLLDEGRSYHICICSYAMHVLDNSYLVQLLQQLALVCQSLIIISPHKLPRVESHTGWRLQHQRLEQRTHARLYCSTALLVAAELDFCTGGR